MWKTWKTPHLTDKKPLFKNTWKLVVKTCEKPFLSTKFCGRNSFPLFIPQLLRTLFSRLLHKFSTLTINLLLNFIDLGAQIKIQFNIFLDFFNTVHYCSVIFNPHLTRNLRSTHCKFFRE